MIERLDEIIKELEPLVQKRKRQDELLLEALDGATDGVWVWYIQEDYEYLSPRWKAMFGYENHELPNHPSAWQDIIFPEDKIKAIEDFEKHIKTKGKYPYDLEVKYRHKNGSTVWVRCRGKVVEWDGGKPIKMFGTHTDITHLKNDNDI